MKTNEFHIIETEKVGQSHTGEKFELCHSIKNVWICIAEFFRNFSFWQYMKWTNSTYFKHLNVDQGHEDENRIYPIRLQIFDTVLLNLFAIMPFDRTNIWLCIADFYCNCSCLSTNEFHIFKKFKIKNVVQDHRLQFLQWHHSMAKVKIYTHLFNIFDFR